MSKKEKLIQKPNSSPKDFTFDDMQTLLEMLGFVMSNKGKTSGSRVKFLRGNVAVILHKPHPRKELQEYQLKQITAILKGEKLL